MKTKIKGRYVVGYRDGDHCIYRDGEVVYEDGVILYVGKHYTGETDQVIDAGDALVGPGFIDLDAIVDYDHGILDVVVNPREENHFQMNPQKFRSTEPMTREELQTKHRYSYCQLLLNGITTGMPIAGDAFRAWSETYEEMADAVQIAKEVGIRMYLGPSYRRYRTPSDHTPDARGERSFQDAVRFIEEFESSDGLVRTFLSPCQLIHLGPEMLAETKRVSERTGVPIRLHAGETPEEVRYLRETFGMTTAQYLSSVGFLGEKTILPHMLYTGPMLDRESDPRRDLEILARSGATVLHAPIAESHGGMALYSLSRYLEAGVPICFGTDTHPADMIQNLNFAWNLTRILDFGTIFCQKEPAGKARRLTTEADLYRAATLGGARALGREDIGRLCPGAKADIITVDLSSPRTIPVEDPIRTLILNTNGHCVRHVIVDGRQVVKDGAMVGQDMERLSAQMQAGFDRFKGIYTEYDREERSKDILFPPAFPIY